MNPGGSLVWRAYEKHDLYGRRCLITESCVTVEALLRTSKGSSLRQGAGTPRPACGPERQASWQRVCPQSAF